MRKSKTREQMVGEECKMTDALRRGNEVFMLFSWGRKGEPSGTKKRWAMRLTLKVWALTAKHFGIEVAELSRKDWGLCQGPT